LFPPSDGLGKGGHQNPGKLVIEKIIIGKKPKICLRTTKIINTTNLVKLIG
jgi:hypothetical protein